MSRQAFNNRMPKSTRETAPAATPVRNTSIPRPQTPPTKVITHEMIAKRAYEISQSPQRGSQFDNWIRAERELKGR